MTDASSPRFRDLPIRFTERDRDDGPPPLADFSSQDAATASTGPSDDDVKEWSSSVRACDANVHIDSDGRVRVVQEASTSLHTWRGLWFTHDRSPVPMPGPQQPPDPSAWGFFDGRDGFLSITLPEGDGPVALSVEAPRSRGRLFVALAVCLPFGLSPALAHGSQGPAQLLFAPADSAVAEAQTLYEQGTARYETSDYKGAVDLFTQAYAKASDIKDQALRDTVLHTLFFNLARAHVKAHRLDADRSHLVMAKDLLQKYLGQGDADDMDATELLAEVERMLDGGEQADEGDAAEDTESDQDPDKTGDADETGAPDDPQRKESPESQESKESKESKGLGLLITGATLTGVGGLVLIGGGAYAGITPYYALTWGAMLGVGATMVGVGIPLLVIGVKKKKAYDAAHPAIPGDKGSKATAWVKQHRLTAGPSKIPGGGWGGGLRFQF